MGDISEKDLRRHNVSAGLFSSKGRRMPRNHISPINKAIIQFLLAMPGVWEGWILYMRGQPHLLISPNEDSLHADDMRKMLPKLASGLVDEAVLLHMTKDTLRIEMLRSLSRHLPARYFKDSYVEAKAEEFWEEKGAEMIVEMEQRLRSYISGQIYQWTDQRKDEIEKSRQ